MPTIKPTHTAIKAARAAGRYSIDGQPGLYLRVRENGAKTWEVRSDAGGVRRYKLLGRLDAMPYDEARDKAAAIGRAKTEGINVIDAEREAARASAAATEAARINHERAESLRPTVGSIAKKYLGVFVAEKRRAQGRKRSADEDHRLYTKYIAPKLKDLKLDELKTRNVAAWRDEIEAPTERRKAIAVLRALLSQAVSDGLTETNPAMGIKSAPSNSRARVLTDDEIKSVWQAKTVDGVRADMLSAIKIQLLTGQRSGEVLAMRWTDIDEKAKTWTVPAVIAKNGREHLVPLAPQAWALIEQQPRSAALVFTAHRAMGRVSSSAFAQVVDRLRKELSLDHFTSHDLRRTAATRMAGLRVAPHVLEAVLNHASGIVSGVAAVYNREVYSAEKRVALEAWARELEHIAAGDRTSIANNVVAIRATMA